MKVFYIFIFVLLILFDSLSYCIEDEAVKNENCVKVYYTEDNFYKIYCFIKSPIYNNTFGITTDKNDTVIYTGIQQHSQCFDTFQIASGKISSTCIRAVAENCMETGKNVSTVNEVPCKPTKTLDLLLGLTIKNLSIVFNCKINEKKVSSDAVSTKYCHNIPVEFDEGERADIDEYEDLRGIIVELPPRYPKRE